MAAWLTPARLRWGLLALGVVVATTLVWGHPGLRVQDVTLDDGGVWVTHPQEHALARFNTGIRELTGELDTGVESFDVVQDEATVLLVEATRLTVVDVRTVTRSTSVTLPAGAEVDLAGDMVMIWDAAAGETWLRPVALLGSFDALRDVPDAEPGPGGVSALRRDGSVATMTAAGQEFLTTWRSEEGAAEEGAGQARTDPTRRREASPQGGWEQATVAGESLVALAGTTLSMPHGVVQVPDDARLQEPAAPGDSLAVATPGSLLRVDLGSGAVTEDVVHEGAVASEATAAPVRIGECVHAAWARATDSYALRCGGEDDMTLDVPALAGAVEPILRSNRGRVVLNDAASGAVWVPQVTAERLDAVWASLEARTEESSVAPQDRESTATAGAECGTEASDLTAVDDEFGVRPGGVVVLDVLRNDSSAGCGVLTVTAVEDVPAEIGHVTVVNGGRSVQLTAAAQAQGEVTFAYSATDGSGSTTPQRAAVTVHVIQPGTQRAPEHHVSPHLHVEQGGYLVYDALADFRDPDGDTLELVSAHPTAGQVQLDSRGLLTFWPGGTEPGQVRLEVVVTDGEHEVTASVPVSVHEPASLPPGLGVVHAQAAVGEVVTVQPLEAVVAGGASTMRLTGVEEVEGLEIVPDLAEGTIRVSGAVPGTYEVPYSVASGGQVASGIVRLDVRSGESTAIVTTSDVVHLPAAGDVTIRPLANDLPPANSVLVLSEVEVVQGEGLELSVRGHDTLTLSRVADVSGDVQLRYTATDGRVSATETITVLAQGHAQEQLAPSLADIDVSVKAGGVVTVPVLEHATAAEGEQLNIMADGVTQPDAGLVMVSGDSVRFLAPQEPSTQRFTVAVTGEGGTASAAVTVAVHEPDPASKEPSLPTDITARVFAGEEVSIPIPLIGIDPDGDGVLLLGQASAPSLGRVTEWRSRTVVYEAYPDAAGTDTFTYAVEDWAGQRSTATIRVAVIPRPTDAGSVTAVDDLIEVRPGTTVSYPVLRNDADAAGGALALLPSLDVGTPGVSARVVGEEIHVTVPASPPDASGALHIVYTASSVTSRDSAVLTVLVADDAEVEAPEAADVVVRPVDTVGRAEVEVDVRALAHNSLGGVEDLQPVVPEGVEGVDVSSLGVLTVTLTDTTRVVPYGLEVAGPDGESLIGYATITVPALGNFPPVLRPRTEALTVRSGESLVVDLTEYVQVAPGKEVVLADADAVSATQAQEVRVVDSQTVEFVAGAGYAGPASLTVTVADGPPGGIGTRESVLSLPVTILATEDYPPRFAGARLDIAPGEEPLTVDLADLTSSVAALGEDGSGYRYRLTGSPPQGVEAALSGTLLTVSAAVDTPSGTQGAIGIAIDYGGQEEVLGRVEVDVVASTRPLARLLDHRLTAEAGSEVVVDVLEGAFNPFPARSLSVVGTQITGDATASSTGGQVTVALSEAARGRVRLVVTVADATGERSRVVQSEVIITVLAPPQQPAPPSVLSVGDGSVELSWSAPAANGAAISGYLLTASDGRTAECATTSCTFEGLPNAVPVAFTVTARNTVGSSEPSLPSETVTPDVVPDAPPTPTLERGDGILTARWAPATSRGTAVIGYDLELAPGGERVSLGAEDLEHVLQDLDLGESYRVRIRAHNQMAQPGAWSEYSTPQVAAAAPGVPTGLRAPSGLSDGSGVLSASWEAPAPSGDPVTYQVRVTGPVADGSQAARGVLETSGTSLTVRGVVPGEQYSLEVRARNAVGESAWSQPLRTRVWNAPGTPTALTLEGTSSPGTTTVSPTLRWTAPTATGGRGITIARYDVQYRLDGAEQTLTATGPALTLNDLPAGASLSFRVRAVNSEGALGEFSPWSAATTLTARPLVTGASAEVATDGTVTLTWQVRDGGSPVSATEIAIDGLGIYAAGTQTTWLSEAPVPAGEYQVRIRVTTAIATSEPAALTVVVPPPQDAGDRINRGSGGPR
ncbi:Ig-like domain-containing protein [Serinibacter salmoneus]|uniref:Ig-like domain-containing protein n=1 Tax=Serinibacter salmoneus TaxID=556530 RepID=UPI000BF7AE24|nr:fibronectin type III domain-containing protein [Serinibacter salmoneus]